MNYWHRLTRRWSIKTSEGQLVLSRAYRAVFRGSPDKQQQEIVLADLAAKCGFYLVSPEDTDKTVLAYREGKRAAFAEIYGHISLAPEDMTALENAARRETLGYTDNELYAQ